MPVLTVAEIAEMTGGVAEGEESAVITSVNSLQDATPDQLAFVASRKAAASAHTSHAGCLLVPADFDNPGRRTVVRVQDARACFAKVTSALHPKQPPKAAIHPTAVIAVSASVGENCSIGPNVYISEHAHIGANCQISAGCVIGENAVVGEHCTLFANVTIYEGVRLGNRVIIHAGCVLGADGFGYAFSNGCYEKFPQIGTVEIGDDVELGANTCVDRAALGATRIGEGTKLDNMVHVAHNCQIGKHVVVAAQTGFSGGVLVGDYAVIGGQVGVGDKATIQAKAVIGSGAGILTSKIVRSGEPVWGVPARPLKEHLQQLAAVSRLPDALRELQEMRRRLEMLERS